MSKINDLTGQRFGKLLVLERAENDKFGKTRWLCQCDCGNQKIITGASLSRGLTTSCGCNRKEKIQAYNEQHTQDETGHKYGRLTVLYRDLNPQNQKDGRAMWVCQCECGKTITVMGKSLRSGHTQSCGCLSKETSSKIGQKTGPVNGGQMFVDLTRQRFGKLLVLKRVQNTKQGLAQWLCKCDCGNTTIVRGSSLRNGGTTSCGCIKSKGETKVGTLLINNNISFQSQYNILINNKYYYFDFGVLSLNNTVKYFIEFDGKQHFKPNLFFGGENELQKTQERDQLKNQWCKDNNIPLIRIPYWHLQDLCIEDLLLETSDFIVK